MKVGKYLNTYDDKDEDYDIMKRKNYANREYYKWQIILSLCLHHCNRYRREFTYKLYYIIFFIKIVNVGSFLSIKLQNLAVFELYFFIARIFFKFFSL